MNSNLVKVRNTIHFTQVDPRLIEISRDGGAHEASI